MKKRAAVIFDCDGVMFDSRQANINFYNHLLEHFGLPLMTGDQVNHVHMHTAEESIRHIFQGTPYTKEAHEYRMHMNYTPFISAMIMEPGLKELLRHLKPEFGLAVATNRTNTIDNVLKLNHLNEYFDVVISSLDVKNPKPHPDVLRKVLDFFDIQPDEAVYVGDSSVDHDAARAAGVPFISYKNRALDADYHADKLMDIVEMVSG